MDPFFDDFDRFFDRRFRQMFSPDMWSLPSFSAIEPRSSQRSITTNPQQQQQQQQVQRFMGTRLDLIESPQSYKIHVDLPGVRKEDIKVHVEGDLLTIEAERKEQVERSGEGNEQYHYSERRFGTYKRQVSLPSTADTSKVEAKFENGVLEVELGKTEESAKRQTIDIK